VQNNVRLDDASPEITVRECTRVYGHKFYRQIQQSRNQCRLQVMPANKTMAYHANGSMVF